MTRQRVSSESIGAISLTGLAATSAAPKRNRLSPAPPRGIAGQVAPPPPRECVSLDRHAVPQFNVVSAGRACRTSRADCDWGRRQFATFNRAMVVETLEHRSYRIRSAVGPLHLLGAIPSRRRSWSASLYPHNRKLVLFALAPGVFRGVNGYSICNLCCMSSFSASRRVVRRTAGRAVLKGNYDVTIQ